MTADSNRVDQRATIRGPIRRPSAGGMGWAKAETVRRVCFQLRAAHGSVSSSPMDSLKKKLDPRARLDQSSIYVLSY
jgi:hypothetical protein